MKASLNFHWILVKGYFVISIYLFKTFVSEYFLQKLAISGVSQWCLRWLKFLSVLPEVSETESKLQFPEGVRQTFCLDWWQTLVETASKTDSSAFTVVAAPVHWQNTCKLEMIQKYRNTGLVRMKHESHGILADNLV